MEFHSHISELPRVPDDLTIPQFFLDSGHELRPARPQGSPWIVADKSGKAYGLEEIQMRTRSLSASLRDEYSIGRDDVVMIFSSNHIDYPICVWAVHKLLGIIAPFNPASTVHELVRHLKLSRTTLIFSHEDNVNTVYEAAKIVGIPADRVIVLEDQDKPPSTAPRKYKTVEQLIRGGVAKKSVVEQRLKAGEAKTQVAFYASSSGTTGAPKIIKISHYGLIANCLQYALGNIGPYPKLVAGDSCLAFLPFFHIYGIQAVLHMNFFCALTVVVVPKFSFPEMLRSTEKYKINVLMLVPPQVLSLCKDPIVKKHDISSLRTIICGAAPLAEELYTQLTQMLPNVFLMQGYGSTESTGIISMTPSNMKHGKHGGRLVPGISGKVVKHDGTLAKYNEEGELYVWTPSAAVGYLDNDEANAETFLPGSWLRTGDLVKVTEEGEIIVIDRVKEMLKVRGFQVAPAELEGCLLDHPFVSDACVVGVPHERSGEVPLAFITLTKAGLNETADNIRKALNQHVATYKAPYKRIHHIEIVDAIPKTPSGKILRRNLREEGRKLGRVILGSKL